MWYKKSKKLLEGVQISSKISNEMFGDTLNNFYEYLKNPKEEINSKNEGCNEQLKAALSEEELELFKRTMFYLLRRLSLFINSPTKLQNDLKELCFSNEKIDKILIF